MLRWDNSAILTALLNIVPLIYMSCQMIQFSLRICNVQILVPLLIKTLHLLLLVFFFVSLASGAILLMIPASCFTWYMIGENPVPVLQFAQVLARFDAFSSMRGAIEVMIRRAICLIFIPLRFFSLIFNWSHGDKAKLGDHATLFNYSFLSHLFLPLVCQLLESLSFGLTDGL